MAKRGTSARSQDPNVTTSKFLSLVLRHDPGKVGLSLGPGGWVRVDDLLQGANKNGHPMSLETFLAVVEGSDKKRFTLSEDGAMVRAAQGHSVPVDLGLAALAPPDVLFHGTAKANIDAIMKEGLLSGRRQQVHLSLDRETATKVGQRHGKPVVLTVAAGQMHEAGRAFFRADNGVWLTDTVPPQYLGT
ncbi:MAG: RNA 2'-phosphotransferase [Devosia sp.]